MAASYSDLPAAFKYRKEYITGCSCKANEYNPTAIEAAGQKAEAAPAPGKPGKKGAAAPAATTQAAAPAAPPPGQLNLDVTGAVPAQPQAAAPAEAAPAPAAEAAPAPAVEAAPAPAAEAFEPAEPQTSVVKRTPASGR